VLAAATVEDLRYTCRYPVWYFFFESATLDFGDSSAAYRSILSQILQRMCQKKDILDIFSYSMTTLSDGQVIASSKELEDLLLLCCQRIGKAFLILDGLDECSDHESLIVRLLKISEISSLRLILFSRPTLGLLVENIAMDRRLSIERLNASDIRLFLTNKLTSLI
jgi:hypothetical protein